jgi:hypothetical protein
MDQLVQTPSSSSPSAGLLEVLAMIRAGRWDAPLWAFVIVVSLFSATAACFGLAVTHAQPEPQAQILTTDDCPPPAEL